MKNFWRMPLGIVCMMLVLGVFFIGCESSDDETKQNLNQSCDYEAVIGGETYYYCYNTVAGYDLPADCANSGGEVFDQTCYTDETCLIDKGAGYYPTYVSGYDVTEETCDDILDGTWYDKK